MANDYEALKQKVLEAARHCAKRGPGYSQQRPVATPRPKSTRGHDERLDPRSVVFMAAHNAYAGSCLGSG